MGPNKEKRQAALRQINLFKFEHFEKAIEGAFLSLKNELVEKEGLLNRLRNDMPDFDYDGVYHITDEDWKIVDEYSKLFMEVEFTNEYLLSLMEMQVVYLFKSLEVIMKRIIQIAYPRSNTKDFFQWDNMKAFFKSNDIEIAEFDGYNACVELRKINNAIKHNGAINDEVKKIPEFNNKEEYNYTDLELFYDRVKMKVQQFSAILLEAVERNLYDFPIDRLTNMANELYERMDNYTISVFIDKLREKLGDDPNYKSYGIDDLPF